MDILRITIRNKEGGVWPLVIEQRPHGSFVPVTHEDVLKLPANFLKNLREADLAYDLETYGRLLGEALFTDVLKRDFDLARGAGSLRVILNVQDEALRALSWQRLCYEGEDGAWKFLARDQRFPFSLTWPARVRRHYPVLSREKLRALVVAANPPNLTEYGLDDFDAEKAAAAVIDGLGEVAADVLGVNVPGAIGLPSLDEIARRLSGGGYSLLHIVAHGRLKEGETRLYLAGNDGQAAVVKGQDFIKRLSDITRLPHLVFLATCESAQAEAGPGNQNLAQQMVEKLGTPAIVAMTEQVDVQTAVQLAQALYGHLAESGQPDLALVKALAGLEDRQQVAIPVLYSQLEGSLFERRFIDPGETKPLIWSGVPTLPRYGLFGRDQLLDDLILRLTSGEQPVSLSISGQGGVGKTALAAAAAYDKDLLAHFSDGVLWASVGPQGDPLLELGRWAQVLGIDSAQYPEPAGLKRAVTNAIGRRRLLLVIDDIWQPEHAELLRCGGPNCAYLLTSRDNRIARTFAGGRQNALDVPDLDRDPAFKLLQTIAAGSVAADEETARDLLQQVGGLPLAVELLGGYLTAESDDEHDIFAGVGREDLRALGDPALRLKQAKAKLEDTAGEKVSLEDLLALSLERFSEEEEGFYYALGAFAPKPAVFSPDAAEAVSGASPRFLRRLVNHNLLQVIGESLAIHQVTADLARKRLQDSEQLQPVQAQHADYYLALVNEDRNNWQRIDDAYEQIRWAWEHAEDDVFLDWIWALRVHQEVRGLWGEKTEWHKRGLEWARTNKNQELEATFLVNLGWVYRATGRPAEALALYEEALPITREVGDRAGEAMTLNNMAGVYYATGRPQEALALYEEALPIRRAVGDRAGEATTLNNMGLVYYATGRPQEALALYEEALPIDREVGDRAGEATTLNNMGLVYDATGRPQEALALYEEALPIVREVGDRAGEAATLNNMGEVYRTTGRPQEALALYEEALPIRREVGDRAGEATTLNNMALVYDATGRPQEALALYEEALPICREVGNRAGEATTLNNMAAVYYATGRPQEALALYEEALPIMREVGNRAGEAATLSNIALLLVQMERLQEAFEHLESAVAVMHDTGLTHDAAGVSIAQYEEYLRKLQDEMDDN